MPLGGLGTGYACWDPSGRFSQCTLFYQVPNGSSVPVLDSIPFTLSRGREYALAMRGDDGRGNLSDLAYFGHFPIADVQLFTESPIRGEVRGKAQLNLRAVSPGSLVAEMLEAALSSKR